MKTAYTKTEYRKNFNEGFIHVTTFSEANKGPVKVAMFQTESEQEEFLSQNPVEMPLNGDDEKTSTEGMNE